MGNDIDDALALAMLHALETKGEAKLLAVAKAYQDATDFHLKHPNIPATPTEPFPAALKLRSAAELDWLPGEFEHLVTA